MMIVNMLIFWSILTSQSGMCVCSKVITININDGCDSIDCCVKGICMCSNNTIINITSKSVAPNNTTTIGSGKLTNITITVSNVTIICNNSGSVHRKSCDHVVIKGITWDRCGDPNKKSQE